jgi:prevent-host-death family protein
MKWKIAEAKTKFSELIHKAEKEPQFVYNRDTMVAAVISPDEFRELQAMKDHAARRSLASLFDELREICAHEAYTIEVPERKNREVRFP